MIFPAFLIKFQYIWKHHKPCWEEELYLEYLIACCWDLFTSEFLLGVAKEQLILCTYKPPKVIYSIFLSTYFVNVIVNIMASNLSPVLDECSLKCSQCMNCNTWWIWAYILPYSWPCIFFFPFASSRTVLLFCQNALPFFPRRVKKTAVVCSKYADSFP